MKSNVKESKDGAAFIIDATQVKEIFDRYFSSGEFEKDFYSADAVKRLAFAEKLLSQSLLRRGDATAETDSFSFSRRLAELLADDRPTIRQEVRK